MTQEKKAQRYDEAIERAKRINNGDGVECPPDWTTCEVIFPELKESEDEKIRKGLLHHLRELQEWKVGNMSPIKTSETYNVWIAWLEKQCNVNALIQEASEKSYTEGMRVERKHWLEKQGTSYTKRDVDDAYLKGVADTKNEIEKQYEANYQIRKDIATFIFNYRGDIKDRAKWMDYLGIKVSFVEMQDEQETLCDKCKKEQPSHSCQDITALGRCAVEHEQNLAWSEEDESYLNTTIAYLKDAKEFKKTAENCIDWLKSLKQKIGE